MRKLLLILLLFICQNLTSQEIATGTNGDVYSDVDGSVYIFGSAVVPFSPTDIAGLRVWYNAENVQTSGSSVTQFTDLSGNGNSATQGTLANQPTLVSNVINGFPVARFDGSNDFFNLTSTTLINSSIFIVYKNNSLGYAPTLCLTNNASLNGIIGGRNLFSSLETNGGYASTDIDGYYNNVLLSYLQSGNTTSVYYQGISETVTNVAQPVNIKYDNIGYSYNTYFKGDIAEILIYDNTISNANRLLLENYLITKYGLQYHKATPQMTSNTAPSGVASASSTLSIYEPYQAFNNNNVTSYGFGWLSTSAGNQWIQYEFPSAIKIGRYQIRSENYAQSTRSPKTWTFEGSNTGAFSGEQTTLDTRTNITGWSGLETREYTFTNANTYKYYRLNMTANNGDAYYSISGLVFYEKLY